MERDAKAAFMYDVTMMATLADGTMLYTDFIPVTVTPAEPVVTAGVIGVMPEFDGWRAELEWPQNSKLVDYYDVYISRDGGEYTLYASGVGHTGSFEVTGLEYEMPFEFKMVAVNAGGESAPGTTTLTTPYVPGYWPGQLAAQDIDSVPANLGFMIDLYGVQADSINVNTNGNVDLNGDGSWRYAIPNLDFNELNTAFIAPFFADVDTSEVGGIAGGTVTFAPEMYEGHRAFRVTWHQVDYSFRTPCGNHTHAPKYDTFSLILESMPETGPGNFDIIFEYGALNWDTADYNNLLTGYTANPARAGYTNGTGEDGTFQELAGSGLSGDDGMLGYQGQTVTLRIRNPRPHLTLQDMSAGGSSITDPNRGVLGVVEDQGGVATVGLSLGGDDPLAPAVDGYVYTVWDDYSNPVGSGALSSTGITNFTTSHEGMLTVIVTNPDHPTIPEQKLRFYVARLNIDWNEPNDSSVQNIVYSGTTDLVNYGDDISDMSVEIYTGQRINLGCDLNLPGGGVIKWNIGSSWSGFIRNYWVTDAAGIRNAEDSNMSWVVPIASSYLNMDQLNLYAIDDMPGKVITLTYEANFGVNKLTFHNQVTFNVHKPGQSIWTDPAIVPNSPRQFQVSGTANMPEIEFSRSDNHYYLTAEIGWTTTLPPTWRPELPPTTLPYVGETRYVQLVLGEEYAIGFFGKRRSLDTYGQWKLDNTYPYDVEPVFTPGNAACDDKPDVGAYEWDSVLQLNLSADDWLMWTAPGADSIPVPIQEFNWHVFINAIWNYSTNSWDISMRSNVRTFTGRDTSSYPTWLDRVINAN
jgi:hypothetical protein